MINVIIPARGGSKGIPKKNIVDLGGHPLIAYSIQAAKLCDSPNIMVSTDDEEIAEVAVEYGSKVIMRPDEYATDDSSDLGFLKHYFENVDCDEVALLRPTTPFRNVVWMRDVIKEYVLTTGITGLRSAQLMNQPAYKQFKLSDGCFFEQLFDEFEGIKNYSNLPRQRFPETYSPNGHIDIVKRSTVEKGSVFGDKIFAVISPKMIDVDDFHDLEIAELMVGSVFDDLSKKIRRE